MSMPKGNEIEQPADLILLTAFTWGNVHLLLLSGIGKPYNPADGSGVVGKNYSWHNALPYIPLFYDQGMYSTRSWVRPRSAR